MITLTENTLTEFRRLAAEDSWASPVVRVGVEKGGCSGTSYTLDFDDTQNPEDQAFQQAEFTIVVDSTSYVVIRGLEVDFSSSLVKGGFRYSNPNATQTCGCGSSFQVAQQLGPMIPRNIPSR